VQARKAATDRNCCQFLATIYILTNWLIFMDEELVKNLVSLYMKRSYLIERVHMAGSVDSFNEATKEIEKNNEAILSIFPKIKEVMGSPKEFVIFLKELIEKDTAEFGAAFAEPYLYDFINILLFDIKRKKLVDKETLDRWKEAFNEEGVEICF